MAKTPPHWNDWTDVAALFIQIIVYVPLLYVILVPWICLALNHFWGNIFFAGFFRSMASMGWLIASVITFLAVLFVVIKSLIERRKSRSRNKIDQEGSQ